VEGEAGVHNDDLRIAKTWELQANVASTQKHASSTWRRWVYYCKEIQVRTNLAGHPDPIQVIQVYIVQLCSRQYDKGGKTLIQADTISKHLSAIIKENAVMVDTTQANNGPWWTGGDRHVSISDLLRAFSRTDPLVPLVPAELGLVAPIALSLALRHGRSPGIWDV